MRISTHLLKKFIALAEGKNFIILFRSMPLDQLLSQINLVPHTHSNIIIIIIIII